jgi:hypothetical protein
MLRNSEILILKMSFQKYLNLGCKVIENIFNTKIKKHKKRGDRFNLPRFENMFG